jgi:2-polyprenyl-3-methyl-5-hydroxy-6-metoxy-1,4-benzoquinol methylase
MIPTSANLLDSLEFSSFSGLNGRMLLRRYQDLAAWHRGDSCLELGCSDGAGLPFLLDHFRRVVGVDGSPKAIDAIRERWSPLPAGLSLECCLFEHLDLGEKFDTVLLGHILEHVDEPAAVIRKAIEHLAPGGAIIASVPNGNSIHRHLGVELGLLAKTTDLNSADLSIGHQRVYLPEQFETEFTNLGLRVTHRGGLFFKPFSNSQIESWLDESQLEGILNLGAKFPDLAAEIFVVAERA